MKKCFTLIKMAEKLQPKEAGAFIAKEAVNVKILQPGVEAVAKHVGIFIILRVLKMPACPSDNRLTPRGVMLSKRLKTSYKHTDLKITI